MIRDAKCSYYCYTFVRNSREKIFGKILNTFLKSFTEKIFEKNIFLHMQSRMFKIKLHRNIDV